LTRGGGINSMLALEKITKLFSRLHCFFFIVEVNDSRC
jgi:hypothetical protein